MKQNIFCRIFGHRWIYERAMTEEGWWMLYLSRTCGLCLKRETFQRTVDLVASGNVQYPTIAPYPAGSAEDAAWREKEIKRRDPWSETPSISVTHHEETETVKQGQAQE